MVARPPPAPGYGAGPGAGTATPPAGPTTGPAHGTVPVGGPPQLDDDTANFAAPRWPGPELNGTGGPATSAYPAPGPGAPGFSPQPPPPGPVPGAAEPQGDPGKKGKKGKNGKAAPQSAASGAPAKSAKKAKKGRSKVVLLGGALFAVVGIAYGAGLLLNHSDVPKGTTVLGVDITGSREDAVAKLQSTFGPRANAPVKLTVGGKQVELKPEKAGLTLDAQTTVRNAAGSDYNPVTVIGSLLGQQRVAEPVMPVDEEKLQAALEELAGTAGSAAEGTIKFEPNKVVAVPGKAGTTLNVDASVTKVVAAYRTQIASGKAAPVELPTAERAPVVDKAELDRAMKEFAEPAMSGNVTIKAGGKSILYGPARSLPKILSMTVVSGKLVDKYDLDAIKELTGNNFDGVLILRGNGEKTAVTPQDIVGALRKALLGKTPAERTATIDTNPS
ncbi:peptidoglycan binding domain-containing protein [Streptomyces sp. NPDC002138]|uniref:peptidoglycan binding domain-containing protein n=1 Tax=Streptomyces sp. NPDC002138 TaxID=3154410 RepID=UPI0033266AC1